ncbi:hypothetical protein CEXT_465881 [Caerostris extrusa]|uniref:Uncharacterized protein n=1 Tax=Caerostris extrusa TaxID=172846 RepID=A0AAV4PWB0_CAEEX|nr:hypothetical protein CEXT_465881 [Caerostris extrusa]
MSPPRSLERPELQPGANWKNQIERPPVPQRSAAEIAGGLCSIESDFVAISQLHHVFHLIETFHRMRQKHCL